MSQIMAGILKCKYCDWQIKRWRTNSKGKRINGSHMLREHVQMQHWEEYEKILTQIEAEYDET